MSSQPDGLPPKPIERLNVAKEKQLLFQTFHEAGRAVRIRQGVATSNSLSTMVVHGAQAIHYTGHGSPQCLAFENEECEMHPMDSGNLCELVSTGGVNQIKFAFVAACCSAETAQGFEKAGVPHVVAIQHNEKVTDKAPQVFARAFYLALLIGQTVQQAFDRGQAEVGASAAIIDKTQRNKFFLMGSSPTHDEVIFNLPKGEWVDTTEWSCYHNKEVPRMFIGRECELQELFKAVKEKGVVALNGVEGIGKSCLARSLAHHMWERRSFGCINFIDFQSIPPNSNEQTISQTIAKFLNITLTILDYTHLFAEMKNAFSPYHTVLLILDNCDPLLKSNESRSHFCGFIKRLLNNIESASILIIGRTTPNPIGIGMRSIKLSNLNPPLAAKLFNACSPRDLMKEIDCFNRIEFGQKLMSHPVLLYLNGHPSKITTAASYLGQGVLMPYLLETLKRHEEDEKINNNFDVSNELIRLVPDILGQKLWLMLELPEESESTTWNHFSCVLNKLFIIEMKSDKRPLNERDLIYLKNRSITLSGNATIDHCFHINDFALFWSWFSPVLTCLKKVKNFWLVTDPHILFHGFISKDEAAAFLWRANAGTFIIRFSESFPGSLGVAFVSQVDPGRNLVEHCILLTNNDSFSIEVENRGWAQYKTLQELILHCSKFNTIYNGLQGISETDIIRLTDEKNESDGPW